MATSRYRRQAPCDMYDGLGYLPYDPVADWIPLEGTEDEEHLQLSPPPRRRKSKHRKDNGK